MAMFHYDGNVNDGYDKWDDKIKELYGNEELIHKKYSGNHDIYINFKYFRSHIAHWNYLTDTGYVMEL